MTRSRSSAKSAGTAMETAVASYLARHVDDRIERRRLTGSKDRGDIGGVRHMGERLVIECKNTAKTSLAGWAAEAETARGNDDALAGIVVAKRHGVGITTDDGIGRQWVHMTLAEFVALITGSRQHLEES